jgi:eukaryotic-like serine/threonine-protein kinase
MGTVLLAEDVRLNRSVALKSISGPESVTPQARERLLHEARAAAALSHPHIAAVHDVLDADGQVIIVFEYVEGETLAATLGRGPLPLPQAIDIAIELADALDAAHQHHVVHRDLKPANIILSPQGHAVVLDFGVARLLPTADGVTVMSGSGSTAAGLIGTPGYAAPEQWAGQHADRRSDLYSLGVVLFEMVAGRRPFEESEVMALGQAVALRKAPRLSGVVPVPEELDALVAALLARAPTERPTSARDVMGALREIRRSLEVAASVGSSSLPRWVRRDRTRRAGLVAAVLLGALVVAGGLVASRDRAPAPDTAPRPPVIAVMPLTALGDEASQDYLAAGVAESLITRLAGIPSITVLSRAAVTDARATQPDLRRLTGDLDAAYLVETGVQQSGDRIRITLNLVQRDGSIVWADSYDGAFSGIFDLQSRMASAVTQALEVQLSAAERKRFEEQPTVSADALAAYWRGRALLERRDVTGNVDRAVEEFQAAIALDPRYALAHAALGEAYWTQYTATRDPAWVPRASEAGTTALRLAPHLAPVRYSLALTLAGSGRLNDALEELQRALVLQPNYDEARRQLGLLLAQQGRVDEAVAEFQKAIALRPNYWGHWGDLGTALFNAARYREAADAFIRVTDLQPDSHLGHQRLGTAYQMIGDDESAIREYELAIAIQPSFGAYSNMGALHHKRGDYLRAVDAYRQSLELRPNFAAVLRNLGDAYRKLGREDEARAAYRRAVAATEEELKVNPKHARNLAAMAVYLAKLGDDATAQARLGDAAAIASDDVQVRYRAAVVHALGGRPDEAMVALKAAIDAGYSRVFAAQDEDLVALRDRPEFAMLVNPEE